MKLPTIPLIIKEYLFHPLVFYSTLAIGILPSLFITLHYTTKHAALGNVATNLEILHKRSKISSHKKNKEAQILSQMRGADPYYLDKYVESLNFLDPEIKKWQRLSPLEKTPLAIEKRLEFLRSDNNRLLFAEGDIQSEGMFREIEEKQKHPVEVNEDDLKKILCAIEGVKISPYSAPEKHPQFLIKQFELTKKMHPDIKEKVFVLSMQLLKRELLSEQSQ